MKSTSSGLWRNGDFRNLWIGQTSAMLGTSMSAVAIPLIASVTLSASLIQMGLISAMEYVPYLLISIFVGVWLDRRPKRPIIILADVVRALALLTIPLAWWARSLSVPMLIGVVLVVGTASVVSDIGTGAILPSLVDRADLVEGNGKLELSGSVSNLGGQTLGGAFIQAVAAPVTILVNAAGYAVSACFTALIRKREPEPGPAAGNPSMWRDIGEGTSFILRHPTIRVVICATLIGNFFALSIEPIFVVFITRTLHIAPFFVGLVFAATGAGSLLGAVISGPISRRLKLGHLFVGTSAVVALASVIIPLATLMPRPAAIALLVVAQIINASMVIVCNISLRSYRSAVTPDELQGRMNASSRMAVMAGAPFGGLAGGALGTWLGTSLALVVASAGLFCATAVLAFSPVRRVVRVPEQEAHGIQEAMV